VKPTIWTHWIIILAAIGATRSAPAASPDDFFEAEVRPILVARCLECHGEAGKPKGGLRLNSREAVLLGGESGPSAVTGKPDESLLVEAIHYVDEPRMPPKAKLADSEIAVLTRWVELGLPWPSAKVEPRPSVVDEPSPIAKEAERPWSFRPVADPPAPAVLDAAWPRSDVDRFVLAGLEAKGLKPASPADRRTLIRRATFDLTGLPPTPEEVAAFLADEAPDPFARVVDRLLATPAYGERWGRHWLDVVRYADARDARDVGSAADITEAYRYRDWVVNAFNRDLPYDQFVVDQIAGDLVEPARPDRVDADRMVATGLLAIGEWGSGDSDKEKMMTDIVADQVDIVGRTFLGLTIACARCHDHKFDPIPTADYYALAGVFFSTKILPDPGPKTAGSPMLRTPIVAQTTIDAAATYTKRLAALDVRVKADREAALAAFAEGMLPRTADCIVAAWDRRKGAPSGDLPAKVVDGWSNYLGFGPSGTTLANPVANFLGAKGVSIWGSNGGLPWVGVNPNGADIPLQTFVLPGRSVNLHPGPSNPAAVDWTSPIAGPVAIRGQVADADIAGGDGVAWTLQRHRGTWSTLASGDLANAGSGRFKVAAAVGPGDIIRLAIAPKAAHTCDTTTIELAIATADGSTTWDLSRDMLDAQAKGIGANPLPDATGRADAWRFVEVDAAAPPHAADAPWAAFDRASADPSAGRPAIEAAARAIQDAASSDPKIRAELVAPRGPFRAALGDGMTVLPEPARSAIGRLQAELDALRAAPPAPIPLALVAREGGVPNSVYDGFHDAKIQIRGDYRRLGEVVPRGAPKCVPAGPVESIPPGTSGRLELAQWLVDRRNPLTARVMVNRIWQQHFGSGIVRTPSNFGKLGEAPTHPELLDHLARRFVESGWSIKAMHRSMMLSSTYAQSTTATAETKRVDPENRLFGRMNRKRLEAEAIRDGLLAVSGGLDRTMGGPAYRDFKVPRRTLYLMTIRSDRSSFGPLFDAADPAAIVDARAESTVASQALFLLNNPFALDQAGALARRVLAEGGAGDGPIERAYELLFARPATAEERSLGREWLGRLGVGGGDKAADELGWRAYCQALLCSNEYLYVD